RRRCARRVAPPGRLHSSRVRTAGRRGRRSITRRPIQRDPMQQWPDITVSAIVPVLDLTGTFVFALSGAMAGVRHRFDLFGVLVLAYAAGVVGGITRDVLIGAVPPPGIADWRYIIVPIVAGLIAFQWHSVIERLRSPVLMFDAGGLALFAVSGTLKALDYQLGPIAAIVL